MKCVQHNYWKETFQIFRELVSCKISQRKLVKVVAEEELLPALKVCLVQEWMNIHIYPNSTFCFFMEKIAHVNYFCCGYIINIYIRHFLIYSFVVRKGIIIEINIRHMLLAMSFFCISNPLLYNYWTWNFPMAHHVLLLVGWFVGMW